MTYVKFSVIGFVTLSVGVFLPGCDRLSEKDKMEMIAMCDSMAKKRVKEETESTAMTYKWVEVSSNYSFTDSRCYALEERTLLLFGKRPEPSVIASKALYDGMTGEKLLTVGYMIPEMDGPSLGVGGSLKVKGMSQDEASKIIKEKMATP